MTETPPRVKTARLRQRKPPQRDGQEGEGSRALCSSAALLPNSHARSPVPSTAKGCSSPSSSFCLYYTPPLLMLPGQFSLSLQAGSSKFTGSMKRVRKNNEAGWK